MKYEATLVSGKFHAQLIPNDENPRAPKELVFRRGEKSETQIVSAREKKILEEFGVEEVTSTRGNVAETHKATKFKFTPVEEEPVRNRAATTQTKPVA